MGGPRNAAIIILTLAVASTACSSDDPAPTTAAVTSTAAAVTTTSAVATTAAPTPPTTAAPVPATTTTPPPTTTTTTFPPLAQVTFEGDMPDDLARIVTDLYQWLADPRRDPPDVTESLREHLTQNDIPASPVRAVAATVGDLPTGERVAVIHVDTDVLFVADEGSGWTVAAASIGGAPLWIGTEPKFLLVLGSDARPGQVQTRLRADSIHVVAVGPTAGGGTIIGFPRDTFISGKIIRDANKVVGLSFVPGDSKWTNLMASRGPEIMLETAKIYTGLPISGYVVTGFVGFEALIRAIGGIVIDVPRTVPSGKAGVPGFSPGEQRLDAARTLLLARIRKTIAGGDFTRSLHQGIIILAAMEMVQNRGFDALPDLLRVLHEEAWTDLPAGDLLAFSAAALLMEPGSFDNLVLPGRFTRIGGSSAVAVDADELERVVSDVIDDGVLTPEDEGE